jgi:tetratricopeptide (TPR) repeat protein
MQKRNAELLNEALELHRRGQLAEAESRYKKLTWREPGSAAAFHALGAMRLHQDRPAEAREFLNQATRIEPDNAEILNALGAALTQLRDYPAAEAALREALALNPNLAEAHNNLSILLTRLRRPEAAAEHSRQAVALAPSSADMALNQGKALRDLGRPEEALAAFQNAVRLAPDLAEAHFAVATIQLALGDFAKGWAGFEWRLRLPGFGFALPDLGKPGWQGDDLAGLTILVHAEQGLGDTLQFLRYVPLVAARGGKVLLLVQPALKRLLEGFPGIEQVFGFGEALPDYDLHCPLMRLPRRFGTSIDTIPPISPLLAAPEADQALWRDRFGTGGRAGIGLCWAGNPAHANDHNRSAPLAALTPLLGLPGLRWVSLQKEVPPGDAATLATYPEVLQAGEALTDMAATAGLIAALDLVISVDTAVAHLAGVMGKPVWLLLPHAPEWRWLGTRGDSPWYPSARLFRQPEPGNWPAAVEEIRGALVKRVGLSG